MLAGTKEHKKTCLQLTKRDRETKIFILFIVNWSYINQC